MLRALLPLVLAACLIPAGRAADYDVHEKVLDNGLRVVALEDRSCPVVAVQVWYHVGSKDEDPGRTGFAHMFEHMMFRGTDRLGPEDHFEHVRGVGGDCNAYTAFDQTVYVQEVPANQLPMVLWLEAERMAFLRVDEEGFAVERAVVEEERRMGLNQPYGSVLERVLANVYEKHPYQWSPIGQIEHLRAATSEELLRFWETYYVPNNAVLVVVGDVAPATVFAEAEKAFGWIPRCPDPPRVAVEEPYRGPIEIELEEERGPAPIVAAAWRTVPQTHPDSIPLEMLMTVLGGGESSRLYRRVVKEEGKAPMAMAGAMALEQDGIAAAGAVAMPFADLDGILALLEDEVARLRTEPVTESELAKAKSQFQRQLIAESGTVASKAGLLGTAAVFHGDAEWVNERPARIEAVTADDLQRVAETYLTPERRITVRIKPTLGGMVKSLLGGLVGKKPAAEPVAKEAEAEPPATSTMAERQGPKASATPPEGYPEAPPVAPPLGVRVPLKSTARTLGNGLEVVVVENHEVPLVHVRLGLLNGAFVEPSETPGSASLACGMLTKGTRGKSAHELADELESNAVQLSASVSMDGAVVAGSSVTGQLGRLVTLLAEVVRHPTFPADEFATLKSQALTALSIAEKQPDAIASRELAKGLFGTHFYARDADGTSDDLKRLAAADCAAWWQRAARPDQAVLYFAGDVAPDDAFELAEALFGDWEVEGEPPAAPLGKIPEPAATRILLVDVPGAIQSQIRVAHVGITRKDPRWAAASVLTQVFGGAFNSRLNRTIRVEKGLTYGARGGLASGRFAGRFFVSTFSKTASTAAAVAAILDEIRRMRDEPPTTEELTQARSYLVGSFAGEMETPQAIAGELWGLRRDGLDAGHVGRWLDAVAKVSAGDVQSLAEAVIDPEHLFIVVVGDAALVKDGLAAIAPVTIVDEAGEPKEEAATVPGK